MGLQADAKDSQKDSGTTEVKSYTKKDGTVVKGYTRKKAGADSDVQKVSGYTKKDGTVVQGYSRKRLQKRANNFGTENKIVDPVEITRTSGSSAN